MLGILWAGGCYINRAYNFALLLLGPELLNPKPYNLNSKP